MSMLKSVRVLVLDGIEKLSRITSAYFVSVI